jgi:hypothetical protein
MDEIGSVGRIARETIKNYLSIKSKNKSLSDREIFREIININYKYEFRSKLRQHKRTGGAIY